MYSMPRRFRRCSISAKRDGATTKAQCCIPPIALRFVCGSLPFGISKNASRLSLPMSKK
jgi:hypothetical protein